MSEGKIKTNIIVENIAPISNLSRQISSGSLKFGIFANNGSGKTFISRIFRLTESGSELEMEEEISPTDKLISMGKDKSHFKFNVLNKAGEVVEDFTIDLNKGVLPIISESQYTYHTFNQDYVEENIRALSYEKDSEIEGFILGKVNIDLKDDEEKLERIGIEGKELNDQVEKEIKEYISINVSGIQNIKRLSEYRILDYQNIFINIKAEPYDVTKSYDELIEDYNKVKSVPENLDDILLEKKFEMDLERIQLLLGDLQKEYSLSSLAEDFKQKIKKKQDFIEKGVGLINLNEDNCPFCEQVLEKDAVNLIDQYTAYLKDVESTTIKLFQSYEVLLNEVLGNLEKLVNNNSKTILKFNEYKTKYIPSSEGVELEVAEVSELKIEIDRLIELVNLKLKDISAKIETADNQLELIEKYQLLINGRTDRNNTEVGTLNWKKSRINEENKAIRKEICKSAYNYLRNQYKTSIESIGKLRVQWSELNQDIKKKKAQQKVKKKDKVASTIKVVLNYFFADKYSLDEDSFRLVFNANTLEKNQAKDVLSEGEKNIVAFAYFIGDTHLKVESEDDYKKLFFVIDDPISSMDFTHVYTLCGVIRDITKILDKLERERIIILTHNNDFMRVLASNNIIDKKLLLRNGQLQDFNNNLTVPYISHLLDIYAICKKGVTPSHTTANSIRHIIETLTKFDKVDISSDSIASYIKGNFPDDKKSYTLINDLSHGGWRTEQAPITEEDYLEVCQDVIAHISDRFTGQVEYCKKLLA